MNQDTRAGSPVALLELFRRGGPVSEGVGRVLLGGRIVADGHSGRQGPTSFLLVVRDCGVVAVALDAWPWAVRRVHRAGIFTVATTTHDKDSSDLGPLMLGLLRSLRILQDPEDDFFPPTGYPPVVESYPVRRVGPSIRSGENPRGAPAPGGSIIPQISSSFRLPS